MNSKFQWLQHTPLCKPKHDQLIHLLRNKVTYLDTSQGFKMPSLQDRCHCRQKQSQLRLQRVQKLSDWAWNCAHRQFLKSLALTKPKTRHQTLVSQGGNYTVQTKIIITMNNSGKNHSIIIKNSKQQQSQSQTTWTIWKLNHYCNCINHICESQLFTTSKNANKSQPHPQFKTLPSINHWSHSIISSWKQSKNLPPFRLHILHITRHRSSHPWQNGEFKVRIPRRTKMSSHRHVVVVIAVLLQRRHKGQVVVRGRAGSRVQEVRRHRRAGEEVVRGGVCGGGTSGQTLHALQVEAVFLEVAGDVFAGQPVDAHELHYGLGNGVLDPQVGHGIHEALVQLWGPHQSRPFQSPRRFLLRAGRWLKRKLLLLVVVVLGRVGYVKSYGKVRGY